MVTDRIQIKKILLFKNQRVIECLSAFAHFMPFSAERQARNNTKKWNKTSVYLFFLSPLLHQIDASAFHMELGCVSII